MDLELFSIRYILMQLAIGSPLLITVIVGIVICHQQRKRRPRASRLLGIALVAELIWDTIGWYAYYGILGLLGLTETFDVDATGKFSWFMRSMIIRLPASSFNAVIWGSALWAVLMIDDVQIANNQNENYGEAV